MWRPCSISDFSSRVKKSGVTSLESMHRPNAHSHAIDRNATSRLEAQLTPIPTGLASIQAETWSTKTAAKRSSLVSQYAWPSVTKWAWRFSSQTTFGSPPPSGSRSEEHTSELQSRPHLVCRLLLEKKKKQKENQQTQEKNQK